MRMVVIAMISLAVAAIAMYMVQTERTSFMDFTDSSTKDADCQLQQAKYKRACYCNAETKSALEPPEAENIWTEADKNGCDWTSYSDNKCEKIC